MGAPYIKLCDKHVLTTFQLHSNHLPTETKLTPTFGDPTPPFLIYLPCSAILWRNSAILKPRALERDVIVT